MGWHEPLGKTIEEQHLQRRPTTGMENKINRSDAICILEMCIIFLYRIMHVFFVVFFYLLLAAACRFTFYTHWEFLRFFACCFFFVLDMAFMLQHQLRLRLDSSRHIQCTIPHKSILRAAHSSFCFTHTHLCSLWIFSECVHFLYMYIFILFFLLFFDCFLGRAKKCYTLTVALMKYIVLSTHYSFSSHALLLLCVYAILFFVSLLCSWLYDFFPLYLRVARAGCIFSTLLLFANDRNANAHPCHIHCVTVNNVSLCKYMCLSPLANCLTKKRDSQNQK